MVAPAAGEECVIIDPGHQATQGVEDTLAKHRLKPVAVILTHGHLDHVASVVPVCGAHDVPAWIHPQDRYMMSDPEKALGRAIGQQLLGELTIGEPDDVRELTDGAALGLAGLEFTVAHAPGHTKGSVTFRPPESSDIPSVFFSGDLLFAGSVGRTDLPGGSMDELTSRWPACACRSTTRPWCSPATAPRRPSAASAPPTPTCGKRPRGLGAGARLRDEDCDDSFLEYLPGPQGHLRPDPAGLRGVSRGARGDRRTAPHAPATAISRPPGSRTSNSSPAASASPPTSSPRRCTPSPPRAAQLALRPEGTASVLRAALQDNLHKLGNLPVKLWYSGSYYRYERPQAGRYRHFSQVGAEAIGAEDPAARRRADHPGRRRVPVAGPAELPLLLNSLGDKECRPVYRAALQDFLRGLDLDEDTVRRAEINPLRVLDDKRDAVQKQLAGAPLLRDYLCEACKAYHEQVRELLTAAGVAYEDDPKLVRGLDYYTRTTFEFVHDGLGSQSAVGGGGRYDGLSEMIGGPACRSGAADHLGQAVVAPAAADRGLRAEPVVDELEGGARVVVQAAHQLLVVLVRDPGRGQQLAHLLVVRLARVAQVVGSIGAPASCCCTVPLVVEDPQRVDLDPPPGVLVQVEAAQEVLERVPVDGAALLVAQRVQQHPDARRPSERYAWSARMISSASSTGSSAPIASAPTCEKCR